MILSLSLFWSGLKIGLEHRLGISSDILHIFVGMLIFLGLQLFVRRPTLAVAWRGLAALEAVNEALDMIRPVGMIESDFASSLHDFVLTMFVPTLLLFLWPFLGPGRQDDTCLTSSIRKDIQG